MDSAFGSASWRENAKRLDGGRGTATPRGGATNRQMGGAMAFIVCLAAFLYIFDALMKEADEVDDHY